MKIFIGEYWYSGPFNYTEEFFCCIIAECESVALGMVLEKYPKTDAKGWEFIEVETSERKIYKIAENY